MKQLLLLSVCFALFGCEQKAENTHAKKHAKSIAAYPVFYSDCGGNSNCEGYDNGTFEPIRFNIVCNNSHSFTVSAVGTLPNCSYVSDYPNILFLKDLLKAMPDTGLDFVDGTSKITYTNPGQGSIELSETTRSGEGNPLIDLTFQAPNMKFNGLGNLSGSVTLEIVKTEYSLCDILEPGQTGQVYYGLPNSLNTCVGSYYVNDPCPCNCD